MTESLYDLLGVEPSATESEIKSAWRSLVTVLGPTDHRFASINDAASVLLDVDKRSAYDETLSASVPKADAEHEASPEIDEVLGAPADEVDVPAGEPVALDHPDEEQYATEGLVEPTSTAPDVSSVEVPAPGRGSPLRSVVEGLAVPLVAGVAAVLAVVLVLATAIAYVLQDDGPKVSERSVTISLTDTNLKPIKQQVTTRESADITAALQAAVAAAPKALSYNYRTLAKDEADGKAVMTADYAAKSFTPYFEGLVKANAPRLKQVVVCGPALDVGVVRTAPNLVEVVLLIDRFATNASGSGVSQDFADITMVNQNGTWLISNFATAPIAK